ncbi:hypothetical protein C1H76_1194 [Elsinoe australis]|uniref:Uncharacterized protein n=1 Tax=Elsinoe australis TaxID=40998 RepID=A0A4V6YAY7_9PEZI|nr:hypothetical protein C1H76_1194 [Elsinoe australis]
MELRDVNGAPAVVSCCSGATRTDIFRDTGVGMYLMAGLMWFVGRTAEAGSRTLVSAAVLGTEASGGFWTNDVLDGERSRLSWGSWAQLRRAEWEFVKGVLKDNGVGKVVLKGVGGGRKPYCV